MLTRANVRHSIMARLARSSWGLEIGVLRTAHTTLLTSLSRYALTTIGSCAYESGLRSLETQHTTVSARRIAGVGHSARIAALHMCTDVKSTHNLYIPQCALMLDRALRTGDCMFQTQMRNLLEEQYQVAHWEPKWVQVGLPPQKTLSSKAAPDGPAGSPKELWTVNLLPTVPKNSALLEPASTYYTHAAEIPANRDLLQRTCTFQDTGAWWRVGLQILTASGWRPDCAMVEACNVARAAPPPMRAKAPIIIGAPDAMRRYPDAVKESMTILLEGPEAHTLAGDIETTFCDSEGISCAYAKTQSG